MNNQGFATFVIDKHFAEDTDKGLSSRKKYLSSKYFYNDIGDKLFQDIMNLDEYYLTRAELNIMHRHKESICDYFLKDDKPCQVIELGAGDGIKTKVLLDYFLKAGVNLSYLPIDISSNILDQLQSRFELELPDLDVRPLTGDYFKMLSLLQGNQDVNKLVLFMGANIGNYDTDQAVDFLNNVRKNMNFNDYLLVGIDLKKSPARILSAYNDSKGVTADFNTNLLSRINEELEGDFDIDQFQHSPTYDPVSGECKSYLISKKKQDVRLEALGKTYHFERWEPIQMEISKKYNFSDIDELAIRSGFEVVKHFMDVSSDFTDVLLRRIV